MALLTSNGLMAPGHFSSSKRSNDLDEPLYLNLWTAKVFATDMPAGLGYSQDDINIQLEGLRSVNGLETQPGLDQVVTQKYKFVERGYTGGKPTKTHLDLTLKFELNLRRDDKTGTDDNYAYKFWRRWYDLVYDPQTGRMSIKKNYICKHMTFTLQDKEGVGYWQWTVHNVFPVGNLWTPSLDYDGSAAQAMEIKLYADTFDETIS